MPRSGSSPGSRSARVVLPGPLRSAEQQVVTAGGGHLEGEPGVAHARGRRRGRGPRPGRRPATGARRRSRAAPPAARRGAGHPAAGPRPGPATARRAPPCPAPSRPRRRGRRAAGCRCSRGRGRPCTIGSTPADGAQPAVEGQLAEDDEAVRAARLRHDLARRRPEHRQRDRRGRSGVPRLGSSAGDRAIVTRRVVGHSRWLLTTAVRHRSRASLTDGSGRPTSVVATTPWLTSACTSTT